MDNQNYGQVSESMNMNNVQQFNSYVANMPAGQFVNAVEKFVPSNIIELKKYVGGAVVQLPDFGPGQPFYARLKRPSMLALVKSGKIPNALLTTANELFTNQAGANTKNKEMLSDLFGVMDTICEASLLEPTYQELKENGIELTDEQLMFIFNYSQTGAKALQSFR